LLVLGVLATPPILHKRAANVPEAMQKCQARLRSSQAYDSLSSGYQILGKVIRSMPHVMTLEDKTMFAKRRNDISLVLNAASTYFETSLAMGLMGDDSDQWRQIVVVGISGALKFVSELFLVLLTKSDNHPEWKKYEGGLNRIIRWLAGVWNWMRGKHLPPLPPQVTTPGTKAAPKNVATAAAAIVDNPQDAPADRLPTDANDPMLKPLIDWIDKLAEKIKLNKVIDNKDLGNKKKADTRLGAMVEQFCALSNDDIQLPPVPQLKLAGTAVKNAIKTQS